MKKNNAILSYGLLILILTISGYLTYEMINNAKMETDLDEYMPKEHPAFKFSDQAEEWFNIKDGILIGIENPNGIYNSNTLQKVKDMSKKLQKMEAFDKNDITSLYTADNITGSEFGMDVRPFYEKVPKSAEKLKLLQEQVVSNDMVYGRLVSSDETVTLIVAGINDDAFSEEFYHEILEFAKSYEDEDNTIYVAGRPIVEGTLGLLGPADMQRMVPLVLIVIFIVLYIIFKSFRATIATLLTVFISSIWTFGLMALLGVPIYSVSTMIPVMLIAIGVAYGIYFYNRLNQFLLLNPYKSHFDAVAYTFKVLWKPLSMAAFTTMIGFLSLLTSEVYPIKYFGVFTAFGIFISYILALFFLPAMILIWGTKKKKTKTAHEKQLNFNEQLTDYIVNKKNWVYASVSIILLISIYGISMVWINSSFLDNFEKHSDIVKTDQFINSKFGGTSSLNVVLVSNEKDAFKQPKNLKLIDEMQNATEELVEVGNSFSMADYLKRMNKVMNEDQDSYWTIPENQELVAQYLLLYEMSGDPQNLTKVANYDYNKTNITIQLKGDDSKTINKTLDIIKSYEDDFAANNIEMKYAGSGYKALVFTDLILDGQIKSILMSLIIVILLLSIMFKSWKAGLIGSVPIITTALISFGVMGLLNIPLSTTTALLSSIAIGIGIDYAIHFMENYQIQMKEGYSLLDALRITMGQTGKAISYNALVVVAGFLVLLFSVFPPNRTLGALVSLNMFTSLLGTLSIMMVILFQVKLFQNKK